MGATRPPASWRQPQNHLHHLLESPWYRLLLRVNTALHRATHKFFDGLDYSYLHVPVTTMSISSPMGLGSDSRPVRAVIEGRPVYLADSLQFLLELGCRVNDKPVYYISSSFRGEDVDKTHLSEFCHSEVEIDGDLDDIVRLGGRYLSHLCAALLERVPSELEAAAGNLRHLNRVATLSGEFPRIRFDEALLLLTDVPAASKQAAPGVLALTRLGESELMNRLGAPLWVTHMPALACPFYQRPELNTESCLSADLLLGPGEILGAGERCRDYFELERSLQRHRVDGNSYAWYLEMKRATPRETSGFGLGMERFLMWALAADDIRDCTLWLRKCGEVIDP